MANPVQPRAKLHGATCRVPGCYCQKAVILMHWRAGIEWGLFHARNQTRNIARLKAFLLIHEPAPGARA